MIQKWLLFSCLLVVVSVQSQALEDTIYNHLDQFIENPTPNKLQQLEEQETVFAKQAKTDEEFLALVVLNSNLGYYQRQFGNNQKAIRSYEKAWKNYREKQLEDYDIIEFCLKPLGNLYTITGDFTNAENTIKSYLAFAEKQNNPTQKVAAILNLSVVYHNTGKHNTAIELLEEGLKIPGISAEQKSGLENNLATNLLALKKFNEAQALLNQKGRYDFLSQRNSAQLAAQQGEYDKALAILEEAESKLTENMLPPRDLARFYVDKASLFTHKNEPKKAIENYQKALQILIPSNALTAIPDKEMLHAENTFLSIFDGLANLQKNEMDALKYYDLSFYVSGLMYEQYTDQEVKIIHQAAWKNRTERCLEILFEHYSKTKEAQYIERAFGYAENSKASVLRESFSKKLLLEIYPEDKTLQKREQLNALQEQNINALIREHLNASNPEVIRELNDTLNTINLELKELQFEIEQKYPEKVSTVIPLKIIQTKVKDDNAILISYFFGKEALYSFVISEKEVRFNKTEGHENLRERIAGFIGYFENSSAINNDIAGFQETAFSLYKSLLPATLPKKKNLILIPDGLLHFVPFEALLTASSKSTSFASMPFLVKQNSVTYNTSATLYHNAKTPALENSVLGVFPVFENSAQPLTYSLDEAENLNNRMTTRLLMHKEATKENFLAFAKAYSILHLSTHAHGGNFTIPAAMEFYDDSMLLHEFYGLNLNPKLVVLSACETGIGKIQTGEGAMSLARGFQYAGAQNLLFSLWQVNDLSTSQVMTSFYDHYSKKNSAFMANRHSKLDYLENDDISNAKKSPYYWSGFVYYGALEQKQEKPAYFTWALLLIGFLIVIWLLKNKLFSRKNAKV
ncbi:MAG: CHAT domain-containing protein [Flavobacteriaceae bacterium]